LQYRQIHSILSLHKLMMKSVKASGNQAMVRKMRAPGFIFVLTGAISAFRPWARIESSSIADALAWIGCRRGAPG
jgi:membrane protein CcdC involved in cytochrome C biogenesis